jgi:predicted dienelactone hydrolase
MITPKWRMGLLAALVAALVSPGNLVVAQENESLHPGEWGPHIVGELTMMLVDASREDRQIAITIWYPGIVPEGQDVDNSALQRNFMALRNAPPDTSNAPYPLILYSHGLGGSRYGLPQYTITLASHGFVVVGLDHKDNEHFYSAVDRPLDILFALDQLAAITDGDLVGFIDTDVVGVMGYSDGAYTALTVNGAQIDPVSAQALTANPVIPDDVTDPRNWWHDWDWNELAAYRAQFSPPLEERRLWSPFTDQRIQAVLAFEPCYAPLFGEHGLASATVPTLLVAGTADQFCPYEHNAVFDYLHLGSEDRYLLSIINGDHHTFTTSAYRPAINHLEAAFFGYYLQGKEDYEQYLTSDYIDNLEDRVDLGLVWGVYREP